MADDFKTVFQVVSLYSGTLAVVEHAQEGSEPGTKEITRRLCFRAGFNEDLIQSECKSGKETFFRPLQFQFHHAMLLAFFLQRQFSAQSACVIGLGGGTLVTALNNLLPAWTIDCVELDPLVVQAAVKYFGVSATCVGDVLSLWEPRTERENVRILAADGLAMLKEAAARGVRYGVLVVDVDAKQSGNPLEAPADIFITPESLSSMAKCADVLVMNVVCEQMTTLKQVEKRFTSVFERVYVASLRTMRPLEELNYVFIAQSNTSHPSVSSSQLAAAVREEFKQPTQFAPNCGEYASVDCLATIAQLCWNELARPRRSGSTTPSTTVEHTAMKLRAKRDASEAPSLSPSSRRKSSPEQ